MVDFQSGLFLYVILLTYLMAQMKTRKTGQNVDNFLKKGVDVARRDDCYKIMQLMKDVTQNQPEMWGESIIGFGDYHYKYESGTEGDWFLIGFSPRKQNLTLYISAGFEKYGELLSKMGKYKTGKSCLYINKLSDINSEVLRELASESVKS